MTTPVTVVIPARFASTRFPGKVLADLTGKPLIQHVYEQAQRASRVDRVLVATDDEHICEVVRGFGGEAVLTRADHPNGTSRIAEAAADIEGEFIVNVQGDEPEIDPAIIDCAVDCLQASPDCVMSTLAAPFSLDEDPADPNIVKVVVDQSGRALLFSRAAIPHHRGRAAMEYLKHVGMYVYRRDFLRTYVSLEPTPLEQTEHLEQLRVLEHGHDIAVAIVNAKHHGIDTPEQYEAFVARQAAGS